MADWLMVVCGPALGGAVAPLSEKIQGPALSVRWPARAVAEFIQAGEVRFAGEEGEQRVFEAVKAAFQGRDALGW